MCTHLRAEQCILYLPIKSYQVPLLFLRILKLKKIICLVGAGQNIYILADLSGSRSLVVSWFVFSLPVVVSVVVQKYRSRVNPVGPVPCTY